VTVGGWPLYLRVGVTLKLNTARNFICYLFDHCVVRELFSDLAAVGAGKKRFGRSPPMSVRKFATKISQT
jgi:hypothetical protein